GNGGSGGSGSWAGLSGHPFIGERGGDGGYGGDGGDAWGGGLFNAGQATLTNITVGSHSITAGTGGSAGSGGSGGRNATTGYASSGSPGIAGTSGSAWGSFIYNLNSGSISSNGTLNGVFNAGGSVVANGWAVVTVAVAPVSVSEDGSSNLVYTFTRTGSTTNTLTVNYTVGGTATLGTDYTGISTTGATKTLTFAAGSSTAIVTVDPTADTTFEYDETVVLTLTHGEDYSPSATSSATGTIANDETQVTLAVSPTSITEDGTPNLIYTFTRTGVTTNALTVNYTVGGTATIGTDYTGIATAGTTKTVTFAAGSSTATVTVDPTADTTVESDETILTLASGTGYTIGTPAQTEQYASTVISFSSEWSEGSWGAVQILGQPNTLSYGASWAPEPANADGDLQADEFITVGFATPVYASGIEVRETYGNGFVRSIDLLSNQGTYYSVWSGIDTSMPGLPVDFRINFDQTSYLVVGARINVDIDHTSGWEEIDSVKLIGTTGAVTGTITNDDFPSITLAVSP
ncbi:MAG: Calx-beta domain-containing protein, partial [Dolichospermum sp.]